MCLYIYINIDVDNVDYIDIITVNSDYFRVVAFQVIFYILPYGLRTVEFFFTLSIYYLYNQKKRSFLW